MLRNTASPARPLRLIRQGAARSGLVALVLTLSWAGAVPHASAQQAQSFTSLKEIRERGIVMQKWETSCAAASLATVLTYGFRDPVSEYQVASAMLEMTDPLKVREEGGFSLLDMKRFVDRRGYTGKAYKNLSFEDLRIFHAPIVPIDAKGYNHYVVFNSIENDRVLLADPAFGNRSMALPEFEKVWMNGMAFAVTQPGPAEPTPAQPPTVVVPATPIPTSTSIASPAPTAALPPDQPNDAFAPIEATIFLDKNSFNLPPRRN